MHQQLDFSDLRPKQLEVIDELCASEGILLVVPMGGGKTVCSLTAFKRLRDAGKVRAALVVAPKAVAYDTWVKELLNWTHLAGLRAEVLSGGKSSRELALRRKADLYIAGLNIVEAVISVIKRIPDHPATDLLIVDELSKMSSPRGAWGKCLRADGGMFARVWGLSGTPRPRGWEDWWSQLNIVSDGQAFGMPFDDFRRMYFRPMDHGGYNWTIHPFAEPIVQRVIDRWAIAVPPNEADTLGFHDGDGHDRFYDLTKPQLDALATLERKLLVELGVDRMPDTEAMLRDENTMYLLTKATATGKMEQVLQGFLYDEEGRLIQTYDDDRAELLRDFRDGNENFLVAYRFAQDVERLRSVLGPALPVIGGGRSDTPSTIADWNKGEIPELAIHPLSGGHGLNLQWGGRRIVWWTNTWSGEEYEQLIARLARPGQPYPVYSHRLRARHWLEDLKIARAQQRIKEQADAVSVLKRVGANNVQRP